MSNLQTFFEMLNQLEKEKLAQIQQLDNKIANISSDRDELKECLDSPARFLRKLKGIVSDYNITNYDIDYISMAMKNTVAFNYETGAFIPLERELELILKDLKSKKRSLKSFLKDITKLKECFDKEAFLIKSFDVTSFKVIQEVIAKLDPKIAAKTYQYLNLHNTKLYQKALFSVVEDNKKKNLRKVVGADTLTDEKAVVPQVAKESIDVTNNKTVQKAKKMISDYQELFSKILTEEEKDCYDLIISEEEYVFNLAVNNKSNFKVAGLVLTYLLNKAFNEGITEELELSMLKTLEALENLEIKIKKEEEESRKLDSVLEQEKDFLESINWYLKEYEENKKYFNEKDWNYIEALNNLNATYHLTQLGTERRNQCLHLIGASDHLTELNYVKHYKLSQIIALKESITEINDCDRLQMTMACLKDLIKDYQEFLEEAKLPLEDDKVIQSNNLVIYLQDEKETLVENFLFNDKVASKNISISHVNSLAYLINVLKNNNLDYLRKSSLKAKGDNLEDKDIRVFASGNIRIAFKIFNREYKGKIVPVVLIISAGIRLGDNKSFFAYINEPSTLAKITQNEKDSFQTIFDGKSLEDIIKDYSVLEQRMLNNLMVYVNNGHRLPQNLNIG